MIKKPTLLGYSVVGMIFLALSSLIVYAGWKVVHHVLRFIMPSMLFVLLVGCATPKPAVDSTIDLEVTFKYDPGVLDRAKAYIDESEEYIGQLPEGLSAPAFNLREWVILFIGSCRTDLALFAENPTRETEANLIISLHNLILSRQLLEEVVPKKISIQL